MDRTALLNGTAGAPSLRQRNRTKLAWMSADELKPGDTVITCDGRRATIRSVNRGAGLSTVHNFAVDGHHTYFVGEGHGVWVHNQYKIEMPKKEYEALKALHGEKRANELAQEYREEKILERFGITDPDRIAEIRKIQADTAAQQKTDSKYRTQIGPTSGPISLELNGKRQLARALAYAGYNGAARTVDANYRKDQLFFEAILASDPALISASNKLAGARMLNSNRNLVLQDYLSVQEFNIVASVGLWKNFVGVDPLPSGDTKSGSWKSNELKAIDQGAAPTTATNPTSPEADSIVRGMVAASADSLVYGRNSGVRNAERGLVFTKNAAGTIGISEITIGSPTANAFVSARSDLHEAFVHAHRISGDSKNQKVGPGDNLATRYYNRPTFMMTSNANRIFEIGRRSGDYQIRRIQSNGSADPWQKFKFDQHDPK